MLGDASQKALNFDSEEHVYVAPTKKIISEETKT
jgi:hypothetical protein